MMKLFGIYTLKTPQIHNLNPDFLPDIQTYLIIY